MTPSVAEYAHILFVTAGLGVSIWLGFLLGSEGTLLAVRRWRHWRAVARRQEREIAEVTADREELAAQLAEAELVIGRMTQGTDDLLDAVRAQGRHHAGGDQ